MAQNKLSEKSNSRHTNTETVKKCSYAAPVMSHIGINKIFSPMLIINSATTIIPIIFVFFAI